MTSLCPTLSMSDSIIKCDKNIEFQHYIMKKSLYKETLYAYDYIPHWDFFNQNHDMKMLSGLGASWQRQEKNSSFFKIGQARLKNADGAQEKTDINNIYTSL